MPHIYTPDQWSMLMVKTNLGTAPRILASFNRTGQSPELRLSSLIRSVEIVDNGEAYEFTSASGSLYSCTANDRSMSVLMARYLMKLAEQHPSYVETADVSKIQYWNPHGNTL